MAAVPLVYRPGSGFLLPHPSDQCGGCQADCRRHWAVDSGRQRPHCPDPLCDRTLRCGLPGDPAAGLSKSPRLSMPSCHRRIADSGGSHARAPTAIAGSCAWFARKSSCSARRPDPGLRLRTRAKIGQRMTRLTTRDAATPAVFKRKASERPLPPVSRPRE